MVALINRHTSLVRPWYFCSPGQSQICLIQSSLERMIEKLLPGHQAEECGGPLQVTVLELGKRFFRSIFLPVATGKPGVCEAKASGSLCQECCVFRVDHALVAILC